MRNLLVLGFLLFAFVSCEDDKTTYEIDDEIIRDYLAETGIDAIKHQSGIYYIVEDEGSGAYPTLYDHVDVNYKGYFVDSMTFDEGNVHGMLNGYIAGWQYGIPMFKKGGSGKLFIPRHLGYNIEVLIFDIELRNVWQE